MDADASQLELALINLAANAAEAMPDGGELILSCTGITSEDAPDSLEDRPHVLIRLSNSGQGIPPEDLPSIFDPFFTTKDTGQGMGLGLSIIYRSIRDHRGHITCQSQPGQGTVFSIYLPLSRRQDTGKPLNETNSRPRHLLLVDDESDVLLAAARVIPDYGFKLSTATSGEEAIKICQNETLWPDLIIMDVGMPGMGGLKALEELMHMNPQAKVLVASGYATVEASLHASSHGAAVFIDKPYNFEVLLKKVSTLLG